MINADIIFIGAALAFFVVSAVYVTGLRKNLTPKPPMEAIIAAAVALLLFVYLLYTMLRPEKF